MWQFSKVRGQYHVPLRQTVHKPALVHTNMCVLGRHFGIRQQKYLGKNVVLCRDPTYVSHARGVELVIEHIEKYWCPSILGESLTRVVPGSAGPVD